VPPIPKVTTYRWTGWHAQELQIGETLPWVAPGDFIELTDADYNNPHNTVVQENLLNIATIPSDEVVLGSLTQAEATTEEAGEGVKT